jgi:hypothetical protein
VSARKKLRERATELEYLKWFRLNADFGPADGDVKFCMNEQFTEETDKELPEGWEEE